MFMCWTIAADLSRDIESGTGAAAFEDCGRSAFDAAIGVST